MRVFLSVIKLKFLYILQALVEEKKKHLSHYQNYLEEVLAQQASLDRVNEKAQSLLQTNADAKTSHAITQLTTRYQGVISLAKVGHHAIPGRHLTRQGRSPRDTRESSHSPR
jgi:hypothetical protein